MALDKTKRKRLEAILKLANDGLSEEKFLQHFKSAVKQILNLEKKLIDKVNKALIDSNGKHIALKNTTQGDLSDLYAKHSILVEKALDEQQNGMNFIYDKMRRIKEGTDGKDGKDGVSIKGEIGLSGKDGKTLTMKDIRDMFEKLEGDERPDISSIRGLRRLLQRLDDRPLGGVGGGGFSKMHMEQKFIDDETPTGTVNGTNKAFTLANLPNPPESLKVYRGGARQRITEDYTFKRTNCNTYNSSCCRRNFACRL